MPEKISVQWVHPLVGQLRRKKDNKNWGIGVIFNVDLKYEVRISEKSVLLKKSII
jgi:hypothetical protein